MSKMKKPSRDDVLELVRLGTAVPRSAPTSLAVDATQADAPSKAIVGYLERHGHHVSKAELARIRTLDGVTPAISRRLAEVVSAFDALATVSRAGWPGGDEIAIAVRRFELLEASMALADASATTPALAAAPVEIGRLISIDLAQSGSTYTKDFSLLIDVGGSDTYLNNAGGCCRMEECELPGPSKLHAAALIDLSGNDHYVSGRSCGVNGGGNQGTGFLFDARGNDEYSAGDGGTNGGAKRGQGFLVDAGGTDLFRGGRGGVNGGGDPGGGFLLDVAGSDRFEASSGGVNGGAAGLRASGMLMDLQGSDTYAATVGFGANGGALGGGVGVLLDGGGYDLYTARWIGVNGGSSSGTATLVDLAGNDRYLAEDSGVNGGCDCTSLVPGDALLLDLAGNDLYRGTDVAVNGGAVSSGSVAIASLIDLVGDDRYEAGGLKGTNGGAGGSIPLAIALLFDGGGADTYVDPTGFRGECTIAPKRILGAQIDMPHVTC
jgi:hypothetical protein